VLPSGDLFDGAIHDVAADATMMISNADPPGSPEDAWEWLDVAGGPDVDGDGVADLALTIRAVPAGSGTTTGLACQVFTASQLAGVDLAAGDAAASLRIPVQTTTSRAGAWGYYTPPDGHVRFQDVDGDGVAEALVGDGDDDMVGLNATVDLSGTDWEGVTATGEVAVVENPRSSP